jgi:hypothetical protein
MFQQIVTRREQPIITPQQLSVFGRFDLPQQFVLGSSPAVLTDEWDQILMFIEAATDEVEEMAATACLTEQVLETYNCFPDQDDPRFAFNLFYQYVTAPWFYGFPSKDSIELVRRPVIVPSGSPIMNNLVVQFNDPLGNLVTLDPSVYTVFANKITLNVGHHWPHTDRREDCVQITYFAGYSQDDLTQVPSRMKMAILFLANHFYNVRQIVSVEPTSEVGLTLCRMLNSFRSMRVPR